MELYDLVESEFLNTAQGLSNDFIEGQEGDILRHFLGDRFDQLKPYSRELLEQWVYDNWGEHIEYVQATSPFAKMKGYSIYTPFEIFVDLEYLPSGIEDNDYTINGNQACINTGYDCLVIDFSRVNFADVLRSVKP